MFGALLSRAFTAGLLNLGDGTPGSSLIIGWAFFLWPGAIDTVARLFGERVLTTPDKLLFIASVVGGFTGMMNGLWDIYRWRGPGALTFISDVNWGLAGNTNAALIHIFDFAWAEQPGTQNGAHRYESGFRIKSSSPSRRVVS